MPAPGLHHLLHLVVQVGEPVEVGRLAVGVRRIVPVLGGAVTGPVLTGRILPGGSDTQLLRSATEAELEARFVLESEDGELVTVHNSALRVASAEDSVRLRQGKPVAPSRVYFRGAVRFETAASRLHRLTTHICVAVGERRPTEVHLDVFEVQ